MRIGRITASFAAVALLAVGWWIGTCAGGEPDGFGNQPRNSVERAVVRQALETWRLEAGDHQGPFRLLLLSERVTNIEKRPGHCETPVPGAFSTAEAYDYQLVLRTYTLFGIPAGALRFTCGGLAYEVKG